MQSDDGGIVAFISYSRRDLPFVRDLSRSLGEHGIKAWVDLTSIRGGDRWTPEIEAGITKARVLVPVISRYSMRSQSVRNELEIASRLAKPIIPVVLDTENVPEALRAIQWIDFRGRYEKAFGALLKALQTERGSITGLPYEMATHSVRNPFFVPVFYLACPMTAKLIAAGIAIGCAFKIMTMFEVARHPGQGVMTFGLICMGLLAIAAWTGYRAAKRKKTYHEMLMFQSIMLGWSLIFGLGLGWAIPFFKYGAISVDVILLVTMASSRAYRRWMIAWPIGWWWREVK